MRNKKIKEGSFFWIFNNLKEMGKIKKEYGIKILKMKWVDEFKKGGIKGIIYILLTKIILNWRGWYKNPFIKKREGLN